MSELFYKLKRAGVALTESEIEDACAKKILSPHIKDVFFEKREDGFYYPYEKKTGGLYKIDLCFCVTSMEDRFNWREENVLLTNFYLIVGDWVGKDKNGAIFDNNLNVARLEKNKDVLIIPLEQVESIEYKLGIEVNTKTDTYTIKHEKSPIAGAVVGGLVAGPAGAVVGAIANQGTKEEIRGGNKIHIQHVYLKIRLKNGVVAFKDDVAEVDFEKGETIDRYIRANEKYKVLINRANSGLSLKEKQEIYERTMVQMKKIDKAAKREDVFSTIFAYFFIAAALAVMILLAL